MLWIPVERSSDSSALRLLRTNAASDAASSIDPVALNELPDGVRDGIVTAYVGPLAPVFARVGSDRAHGRSATYRPASHHSGSIADVNSCSPAETTKAARSGRSMTAVAPAGTEALRCTVPAPASQSQRIVPNRVFKLAFAALT